MVFALVLICFGTLVACGMPRFNLEVIAADRDKERTEREAEMKVSAGGGMEKSCALAEVPTIIGMEGEGSSFS